MSIAGWIYDHVPQSVRNWMDQRTLDRQAHEEYEAHLSPQERVGTAPFDEGSWNQIRRTDDIGAEVTHPSAVHAEHLAVAAHLRQNPAPDGAIWSNYEASRNRTSAATRTRLERTDNHPGFHKLVDAESRLAEPLTPQQEARSLFSAASLESSRHQITQMQRDAARVAMDPRQLDLPYTARAAQETRLQTRAYRQ